ncbi:MAG: LysM peptidoglycan-binding domain-containing protein [Elusimicrobiota bacterium]|nr:LysM peptidoglycan-binding domain-containing protein [Elusimicrobiota bacterium]
MKRIMIFAICGFLAACGGKKALTAEEEARLNARDAMVRAEKMIAVCAEEEVPVAAAENLLGESKKALEGRDYLLSKEKADASYSLAKKALDDMRDAREKALEAAKKEFGAKRAGSYTVRSWFETRDCLWNIAKQSGIYNDPWQWKKIYMANRDKIKDPDVIYKGQVFKIPR